MCCSRVLLSVLLRSFRAFKGHLNLRCSLSESILLRVSCKETAPYTPTGAEKKGTKPDRFAAIARNFYWLNVTRFYAGCYSKGELPSLVDGLRELIASTATVVFLIPVCLLVLFDRLGLLTAPTLGEGGRATVGRREWFTPSCCCRSVNGAFLDSDATGTVRQSQFCDALFDALRTCVDNDFANALCDLIRQNGPVEEQLDRWLRPWVVRRVRNARGGSASVILDCMPACRRQVLTNLLVKDGFNTVRAAALQRAGRSQFLQTSDDTLGTFIEGVLAGNIRVLRRTRISSYCQLFAQAHDPDRYRVVFFEGHIASISELGMATGAQSPDVQPEEVVPIPPRITVCGGDRKCRIDGHQGNRPAEYRVGYVNRTVGSSRGAVSEFFW